MSNSVQITSVVSADPVLLIIQNQAKCLAWKDMMDISCTVSNTELQDTNVQQKLKIKTFVLVV